MFISFDILAACPFCGATKINGEEAAVMSEYFNRPPQEGDIINFECCGKDGLVVPDGIKEIKC